MILLALHSPRCDLVGAGTVEDPSVSLPVLPALDREVVGDGAVPSERGRAEIVAVVAAVARGTGARERGDEAGRGDPDFQPFDDKPARPGSLGC